MVSDSTAFSNPQQRAWKRIRLGFATLTIVFVMAVVGYRCLGYSWLEAVWMVVITIATVGYGERSQAEPAVMVHTVAVILVGITSATYTFAAIIQFAVGGEVERFFGKRKMKKEIARLQHHVVLCGYGSTGELLAATLRQQGIPLVIVERDTERVAVAESHEFLVYPGDATSEEVLLESGLASARAVIISLPSDAENVFITLTARNLSREIKIVARAESPSTERKLRQAGANRVVMPSVSGARLMARMVTRPSTADLIEIVSESTYPDLELDEIEVRPGSRWIGRNVHATEAQRKHRLLVVSVKPTQGAMIFNPDESYQFQAGDTVILLGKAEDIQRFRDEQTIP